MRTGVGLRNALLCLFLVVGLHIAIVKPVDRDRNSETRATGGTRRAGAGGKETPPATSTMMSDIRRRRTLQRPSFAEAWPPGPEDLAGGAPAAAFEPAHQKPYTLEDEERAALHRLVFSQPAEALDFAPKPGLMPDHSGLHMAAETSISNDLPMYYIKPGAQNEGNGEYVSGMLSWGAGYQPLTS